MAQTFDLTVLGTGTAARVAYPSGASDVGYML